MNETFLILDDQTCAAVSGPTMEGAALVPLRLSDGLTHVLPVTVLDDPAHARHHAVLAERPRRIVGAQEWPPSGLG